MRAVLKQPEFWVFTILFSTYAYFWQARDWNSASRLMLTYAFVDRGAIAIDGLENQTNDRAFLDGHYYTDKFPGFSTLGVLPYVVAKWAIGLPSHPLKGPGLAYWRADYWVTLGTSGLSTALAGAVLAGLARKLGCGPRRAALVGLAYGLSTPAYPYATLAYGHQAAAFASIASFALLWEKDPRRQGLRMGLAGFLAAFASVIELPLGPVSAILGLYLLAQVLGRVRKPAALGQFAVGALIPTLFLLLYNQLAFGSPFDTGYSHLTTKMFAEMHSEKNPLGLQNPQFARVANLLWGRYRGLLFYAPIVSLVPFGLVALWRHRQRGMVIVASAVMLAVFGVNLSYPAWTGGWTTGPRLLVPLLPFAMLPLAGLLAIDRKSVTALMVALTIAGAVLMLLFVGIGARVPQYFDDPLIQVAWPRWCGKTVAIVPDEEPFARNLLNLTSWRIRGLTIDRGPASVLPLMAWQLAWVGLMLRATRRPS